VPLAKFRQICKHLQKYFLSSRDIILSLPSVEIIIDRSSMQAFTAIKEGAEKE
jgi:hypothetical protein